MKQSIFEITTAVAPSKTSLSKLRLRLEEKFGDKIRLAVKVDPAVIGGAIIVFNGRYFDYSLKKRLEEYFSGNKLNEIL